MSVRKELETGEKYTLHFPGLPYLNRTPTPLIVGIFCAALEGHRQPLLPGPVYHLARLPDPVLLDPK